MNYKMHEFYALMESVESQGGEHLDKVCAPRTYPLTGDKGKDKEITFKMCGNSSLFVVPYEALDKKGNEVGLQPVEVCAVDDDMGRWPRFGGDRFGKV